MLKVNGILLTTDDGYQAVRDFSGGSLNHVLSAALVKAERKSIASKKLHVEAATLVIGVVKK